LPGRHFHFIIRNNEKAMPSLIRHREEHRIFRIRKWEATLSVGWILKEKGRSVLSVLPTQSLAGVVDTLAKNKIGAVVVTNELMQIQGILSERDIVRILSQSGPSILQTPVSNHMTKGVITCSEDHTIDWVMNEMTAHRFRHMPVVKDGRLAGIISIGDVVKYKLAMAEAEAAQMRQYFAAG
jgi:CBS domain-containing protein